MIVELAEVSIRAPVKGAIRPLTTAYKLPGVSIRAPVKGAMGRSAFVTFNDLFQSAPP